MKIRRVVQIAHSSFDTRVNDRMGGFGKWPCAVENSRAAVEREPQFQGIVYREDATRNAELLGQSPNLFRIAASDDEIEPSLLCPLIDTLTSCPV